MNCEVCPHCQREVTLVQYVECDGHRFPTVWRCKEHGMVPPMRPAVVNRYSKPDWSTA